MATGKAFCGGFMDEKLDHRGEINFVRIINANEKVYSLRRVELNR